jgi:hypothetical protein
MGAYRPSMLVDYRAGRPLESATIVDVCLQERDRHAPDMRIPEIERLTRELAQLKPGPTAS